MASSGPGPRLAFATWRGLPELTADDRLAAEALRRRGATVQPLLWDPQGGARFDAVVVRSVWDYHHRPVEFLRWVETLERAGTLLLNPPAVLRWNHHKSYLRDLAARGVATVPTVWLERGADADLGGLLADRGWVQAVVKPAISASAHETWVTSPSSGRTDQDRLRGLLLAGDALVQPVVPEVRSKGEWSLIFLGGEFSHAMLKRPREGDFRVQEELGGRAWPEKPSAALVEQARQALAAAPAPCLYARVDGVERDGGLVLMELELIEPVLYFGADPGAADRFAGACLDRMMREGIKGRETRPMALETSERNELIARYAAGPATLRAALAKVPAEALQWRPGPGRWSVHEIVCHCADSETNAALRIRTLAVEKDPLIMGYDQDAWAAGLDYHEHPLPLALATVDAVRANTVPVLRRLSEKAWARVGRHSESGSYGALDWLRSYAEHLEKHSRQIGRNLEAWHARSSASAQRP